MGVYEIVLSFCLGLLLLILSGVLFRLSFKGISRLILNALFGAIVLILFSVTGLFEVPVNPLNAIIVGYLGVFGLLLIIVFIRFL